MYDFEKNLDIKTSNVSIPEIIFLIANTNKNRFIGWCHVALKDHLNLEAWKTILPHKLVLISYETTDKFFINSAIGYVEDTPFLNVNKKKSYPTWLMSSDVGVTHATVIIKFESLLNYKLSFNLFLNSIAKIGMKKGLLCYSNPILLKSFTKNLIKNKKDISIVNLLWFIKSNYKKRWLILFMMHLFLYRKQLPIIDYCRVIFMKSYKMNVTFEKINKIVAPFAEKLSIDVIIPTLGREKYLKDVLIDLSKQTILPKKVIIIEQNPIEGSESNLKYLAENWPFEIDHTLIYQLGACNARNLALEKVSSDWVFFADDDIRFKSNLFEIVFNFLILYKAKAFTISCLQKGEKKTENMIRQSSNFGSGTSIVKSDFVKKFKFDMTYEFGFGEDVDFGMQLRNLGVDILYLPYVTILHLKAPIGGFRKRMHMDWDKEPILPKPAPTVMAYKLKYATKEQLQAYKTLLFLKFYKHQKIKNPISYYRTMRKAWGKSNFWAEFLIKKYSNEI